MTKPVKITLWVLGVTAATVVGLGALGYSMHKNAVAFVKANTEYKNVRVVTQSDDIFCPGAATGLVVGEYDTPKALYFPVCVNIMGKTALGKWNK